MFCKKCGKQVPDGVEVCSECAAQTTGGAKADKKTFFKQIASASVKKNHMIAGILAIVCVLLLVFGTVRTLNMPLYDIPVVSLVESITDPYESLEEILTENVDLDELEEQFEDALDEYEDELSKKEEKMAEKLLEKAFDCIETPSFANLSDFYNTAMDAAEIESYNFLDTDDDEMDVAGTAITAILIVLWVITGICVLFAILAYLQTAKGWTIPAMIIYFIYAMLLVGTVYAILTLAALIVYAVFLGKSKKAYKEYLKA